MNRRTIDILESAADTVCQHRQKWDPELRNWHQREKELRQTLFQQHGDDPELWRQVSDLLDAQDATYCLQQELYFRLGLQMGLQLGTLNLFPEE